LSLTAVDNLADACLAALGLPAGRCWPGGTYNIADAEPYRRDAVVAAVLGTPVRHVPIALVRPLTLTARISHRPVLTRYAVDQLTDGMVLDTTKARHQGWHPRDLGVVAPNKSHIRII
jgi:nucleoside-diphosphate-sugar epimerase